MPISHISAAYVSTTASSVILIHRTCHLACLVTLSSSTCVSPVILIPRRLHHPVSLPPPSLLFYVYAASLLSLFPPFYVSTTAALPYCAPAASRPPITTEQRNRVSWAPRSGRPGVCVLIRRRRFHSGQATARHHIGLPMFRFLAPKTPETPATVCNPILGRRIFLLGLARRHYLSVISESLPPFVFPRCPASLPCHHPPPPSPSTQHICRPLSPSSLFQYPSPIW